MTARSVHVGLSITQSEDFRAATLPLFERGLVDALEWNIDTGWSRLGPPDWVLALLAAYSEAGRLYGHGVEFSLLSAELSQRQRWWLARLAEEVRARRFVHLSEHFGFLTAGEFVNNTVMPHPRSETALRLGRGRLAMLSDVAGMSVGLENLALAFSRRDVEEQPDFLDALLEPGGGFLLLDLHNLYCQAVNFNLEPLELLGRYPLARVRELHVAGGELSYPRSDPQQRPFRRDSHVGDVPDDVYALLREALARCENAEVVIVERSDHTLASDADLARFGVDFERLRAVVGEVRGNTAEATTDKSAEATTGNSAEATTGEERR